jgi:AcrR family transcriptional regulator
MNKPRRKFDRIQIGDLAPSRIKNPDLVRKKRLHIARTAAKLFIKKGYTQTTMREVSKATGMAVGNLYDYISKKEDLLCLVFDVYHQYVEETLIEGVSEQGDPKARLEAFIRQSVQNVQNFRDEIVLMYQESRMLPKQNLKKAMAQEIKEIQTLAEILQAGADEGVFHVQEPFFAASMIFYQIIFPTLRGWTFRDRYSEEEMIRLMQEYILKPVMD